jgi:hypothetical protein
LRAVDAEHQSRGEGWSGALRRFGPPLQTNYLLVSMIEAGGVRVKITQWAMAAAIVLPENVNRLP